MNRKAALILLAVFASGGVPAQGVPQDDAAKTSTGQEYPSGIPQPSPIVDETVHPTMDHAANTQPLEPYPSGIPQPSPIVDETAHAATDHATNKQPAEEYPSQTPQPPPPGG